MCPCVFNTQKCTVNMLGFFFKNTSIDNFCRILNILLPIAHSDNKNCMQTDSPSSVLAAYVNLVSPEGDQNKTALRRNDVTLLMSGSDLLEHIVCSSRIKSVSSSENTDRPTGSLAQGGGRKQV